MADRPQTSQPAETKEPPAGGNKPEPGPTDKQQGGDKGGSGGRVKQ